MKAVRYERTLIYYDGHQVFLAHDLGANPFVGALISQGASDKYIVAQVDSIFLEAFMKGRIDLLRLMLSRVGPGWYLAEVSDGFDGPIGLQLQPENLDPFAHLPEPGLYIEDYKFRVAWNSLKPLTVHAYSIHPTHAGTFNVTAAPMAIAGGHWHVFGQSDFLFTAQLEDGASPSSTAVAGAIGIETAKAPDAANHELALAA